MPLTQTLRVRHTHRSVKHKSLFQVILDFPSRFLLPESNRRELIPFCANPVQNISPIRLNASRSAGPQRIISFTSAP